MAVYTEVSDEALSAFLTHYEIGALLKKTPIAEGVENTNYKIETDQGPFILTLFEKRVNRNDLPFFMALKKHLADQGTPVPAPIADKNGETIAELCGRPAVIIEFMPGRPVATIDEAACRAIGAVAAELQNGVADFPLSRANPLSLNGWRELAGACAAADKIETGLSAFVDTELQYLAGAWPSDLPGGVVHSDLFPDNVLFSDGAVSGVIDFYFAAEDFFAYDVAVCINAWCFDERGAFNKTFAKAFFDAYQEKRGLSASEIAAMPVLFRGAALRFLLTRVYDWLNQSEGALVTVKDPLAYKRILSFHQNANALADIGIHA